MSETAQEPAVIVRREGAVAIVTLNEPRSMNALSGPIKDGLAGNMPLLLDDDTVRCIVLTGTGRAFCAGGDIRAMDERGVSQVRARMERSYRWLFPLLAASKPIVTAINGAAAGAGLSLALTGDIIVAARDARFKAGFPGLGACPDLGVAYTLPRAVGLPRAADILLTNREVSAEEAFAMGLVTRLVEPEQLMATTLEIAQALAAGPTQSLRPDQAAAAPGLRTAAGGLPGAGGHGPGRSLRHRGFRRGRRGLPRQAQAGLRRALRAGTLMENGGDRPPFGGIIKP